VAPFFPVSAATADVPLVTLAMLLAFAGPRTVMVALPFLALFVSFLSDRSPALLLLGYVPLLPFALALERVALPFTQFGRLAIATVATGMCMRLLLSIAAIVGPAELVFTPVIVNILLPGLFFDLVLVVLAYIPFRVAGWEPRSLSLARGRY
jgi:hypothetical protein